MKTETYWPQDQIYLYATCALFPERIRDKKMSEKDLSEYIHFFFDTDEQSKSLDNLKSQGMLTYVKKYLDNDHTEYVISEIDQNKFKEYLIEYLDTFRNDELLVEPTERPETFSELEKRLLDYLASSTKKEPQVNPLNIWQDWNIFNSHRTPFWEMLLCAHLLTKNIEIKDIGISKVAAGDTTIPHARVIITADLSIMRNSDDKAFHRAEVIIEKTDWKTRKLIIRVDDGIEYVLKDSLRTDLAPHSLMQYLINNPGKEVTIKYAHDRIEGCENVKKLSEVLRQCGFDDALKDLFFDKRGDKAVQLKKDIYVRIEDLKKLK